MMLSTRDHSMTTRTYLLLLIIITVICIAVATGAKNQIDLKNSSAQIKTSDEVDYNTEIEVKEEPYNSVWTMMYEWWNWMIGGYAQSKNDVGEPRTFGAIRRLQMALIPIAFKFGIVFAMIKVLVFLAIKTVFLLKLLLVMNAAAIFAKILLYKGEHYNQQSPSWGGYNGWNTAPVAAWPGASSSLNKEVHLHIHGGISAHKPWERSDYEYNTNGVSTDTANELSNRGSLPYHRIIQAQHQPNNNYYYVNGSG